MEIVNGVLSSWPVEGSTSKTPKTGGLFVTTVKLTAASSEEEEEEVDEDEDLDAREQDRVKL